MIGFKEEFEVGLQMSEQEFAACLLSFVDTDLDEISASLANTDKAFRGYVKFNRFQLTPIQTFSKKTPGRIHGEFKYGNDKLLVKAKVVNDKFLLAFLIGFLIMSLVFLINYIYTNSEGDFQLVAMVLFFIIGIGNLIGIKRNLKQLQLSFMNELEIAVNKEYRKANKT